MEKPDNDPQNPPKSAKSGKKPPGQFISADLEAETARFIEEVKGLARRRKEVAARRTRGLPPPRK